MRRVALLAVPANLLAVASGLLNAHYGWNGLQVPSGPAWLDVTVYPPLLISVLSALWLGPTWGIVPAYLANLASAVWSGIPWATSLVFALAGAVETAILWGSMVTLNISPDLRKPADLLGFLAVSVTAPAVASLSVLIWNTALGLDLVEGQRIWRGWMLGDFAQLAIVIAPILYFAGPRARRWIDRQFAVPPRRDPSHMRRAVFASVVFALTGALALTGVIMLGASLDLAPGTRTARGELLAPRLQELRLFLSLAVVALVVTTAAFSTGLAQLAERQRTRAVRDSLTGCLNRRAFQERFAVESDRSARLGKGLSLIFVDVDHFKTINDSYGHDAGDAVLQQVAWRLQDLVRDTDLLFRWGGEEFVILLAHTEVPEALVLAERLRTTIADEDFRAGTADRPARLTVSVGVAAAAGGDGPDDVIARADAACYRVKQAGRNGVATA
jgi:diguanylate cyclase (GGDEF)-like protein